MRAEIFQAIRNRIKELVPQVKYIDLWNDNIANIEGGMSFNTPAVFIEFEEIQWQQGAMGARRGEVFIRLHIIDRFIPTDGSRDELSPLTYLQTIDDLNEALWGLSGQHFAGFMLKTSSTDHSHKELLENIEQWVCTASIPAVRQASTHKLANLKVDHKGILQKDE